MSERTVTEKYHDDLMHEWKVSEVAKDNRIADLEAELVKAWKKLLLNGWSDEIDRQDKLKREARTMEDFEVAKTGTLKTLSEKDIEIQRLREGLQEIIDSDDLNAKWIARRTLKNEHAT